MKYVSICAIQAMEKFIGQSREWYVVIMSSLGGYIFSNIMHVILRYTTLNFAISI